VNKFNSKFGVVVAAAAFSGLGFSSARAEDLLYDWRAVNQATTPVPSFTPAPFLTNANAAAVVTQLTQQQTLTPGKVAVKIDQPLSPATIATIFNNPGFKVNYAFLDYEGQGAVATAQAVANQIHAQPKSTTGTYVGNFNVFPGNADPTGPSGSVSTSADYTSGGPGGLNMANEGLYPGAPTFKTPSDFAGGTSTSPNIRSALFVLPIQRASVVSASLPAGHQHIPYVNRFNNVGNTQLQNGTANPGTGNQPAFYADAAHGTSGQMLSRGDFSAMIAHYKARGVDGVHLLDGGVIGYTQQQFEQDADAGWHFAPFETILNGGGAKKATLDTIAKVDGTVKSSELSGVVFSGVYSLTQAGGAGKLALLVSNLDDDAHSLEIPQKIGGKTVPGAISILAGQHKLLDFTGAGSQWSLQNPGGTVVFADNNRDGVGVPEPMAMGGVALFALGMLGRRRRRTV